MTAPGTENGRVTLAILGIKLDTVIEKLENIEERQSDDHDRLGKVESLADSNQHETKRNARYIEKIDARSKAWNGLNSLGAVVAGVLAGIWGNTS